MTCTESVSGSLSASTCDLSSARRSPSPQFNTHWTVLDIVNQGPDAKQVLNILTGLFPYAQLSGGLQPVPVYITDPYHAVGTFDTSMQTYDVGREVFETGLVQLLNSILYMGINSTTFTGSFNSSSIQLKGSPLNLTATNTIRQELVRCSRPRLGMLIIASLAIFIFALIGAFLRISTLTPDVLGSISVALLQNRKGE